MVFGWNWLLWFSVVLIFDLKVRVNFFLQLLAEYFSQPKQKSVLRCRHLPGNTVLPHFPHRLAHARTLSDPTHVFHCGLCGRRPEITDTGRSPAPAEGVCTIIGPEGVKYEWDNSSGTPSFSLPKRTGSQVMASLLGLTVSSFHHQPIPIQGVGIIVDAVRPRQTHPQKPIFKGHWHKIEVRRGLVREQIAISVIYL